MVNDIVIAIIGSSALTTLISGIINLINGRRKANAGIDEAISFLLLSEIMVYGEKHLENGMIDLEGLKHFTELYGVYKRLGGNGYADAIKSSVEKLPIKE